MLEDTETKYYKILDKEGRTVAVAATRKAAIRKADRLDNAYGAYAHSVVPVEPKYRLERDIYGAVVKEVL